MATTRETKNRNDVLAVIREHPDGITTVAITNELGLQIGEHGGASVIVKQAIAYLKRQGLIWNTIEPDRDTIRGIYFPVEQVNNDTKSRLI